MAKSMAFAGKAGQDTRSRLRHIEGRHNALVKELRLAFSRAELTPDDCCAIEGLRIVEEAIRSGMRFRAVFFSASAEDMAKKLLPQIGAHVETVVLPAALFASVVPSETPQGVAALMRWQSHSLEDVLSRAQGGPVVVIAGVQDPGNVGTILRSAEAFGAGGVLLGEGTASVFNSKVVRSSAGSVFRVPMTGVRLEEAVGKLRTAGLKLVATSSHKGTPLPEAELTGPLAIFIGNEGAGLPKKLMGKVDELISIPHSPQVESLNAGVAASIVLYEAAKQRSETD